MVRRDLSIGFTLVLALLAVGAPARAGEPPAAAADRPAPRNHGNLRVGVSAPSLNGRPALCLDVAPLAWLSVEACGTGSGFLHHDADPELAHFRAWLGVGGWRTRFGWLEPRVGAGFAELQEGEDDPGFQFGGVSANRLATAGPELAAAARLLIAAGGGWEWIVELSVAAAWLGYAPDLYAPKSSFQPAAGVSFGFGW